MTGRPIRVYADTAVYGGVFDDEYSKASRLFFDDVIAGKFRLVISAMAIHTPQEVILHEDEDL